MYQINSSYLTTFFLVSYYIFVTLICTALVMGFISRLIILYFEKDFEFEKPEENMKEYDEILSESETSENEI